MSACQCPNCSAGMPAFCLGTSYESNQEVEEYSQPDLLDPREDGELVDEDVRDESNSRTSANARGGSRGARTKRTAVLGNQQSSGRKEAGKLYPLNRAAPCEWQGLAECGGGTKPILGCVVGTQRARHHGPDKNVTNNEQGNVHRICDPCHYRWHRANDENYDWNATKVNPHQPRPQTEEEKNEALFQDLKYRARKADKTRNQSRRETA